MGADRAPKPEVDGAILAARHYDVEVLLVGKEAVIRKELRLHPLWQRLPIEIVHASRSHRHAREGRAGSAFQARLLHARGTAPGARWQGRRIRERRQYRRMHGHRQDGAGHAARRGSSRAGRGFSDCARNGDDPDRRWRQRRLQAGKSAAVRHHGRRVFPHDFCRTAFPPPSIRAWACSPSAKKNPRATS